MCDDWFSGGIVSIEDYVWIWWILIGVKGSDWISVGWWKYFSDYVNWGW